MVGKVLALLVFNSIAGIVIALAALEYIHPGFVKTWFGMITGLETLL